MDRIFGIPAHPLLVHVPVVIIPLVALMALALVIRPSWVRSYGLPLVVLSIVSGVGTVLATQSGEGLQENILKEHSAAIESHAEWGDRTKIAALIFMLLAIVFVVMVRKHVANSVGGGANFGTVAARSSAVMVVSALLAIVSVASVALVMETGHTGAKSAWEDAGKAK